MTSSQIDDVLKNYKNKPLPEVTNENASKQFQSFLDDLRQTSKNGASND